MIVLDQSSEIPRANSSKRNPALPRINSLVAMQLKIQVMDGNKKAISSSNLDIMIKQSNITQKQ